MRNTKSQLDGLTDLRKLLLVYRIIHHNDPIPSVKKLNIKNRDKQLCKSLIRLFRGTTAEKEILKSLSKLLGEKKQRKANTLDAVLYRVVVKLVKKAAAAEQDQKQTSLDKDKIFLKSASIWSIFITEVGGELIPNKPQSVETEEFGTVSKKQISPILKDRFGGDSTREKDDSGSKGHWFSRSKLTKLEQNYSLLKEIKIEDESGPTDQRGNKSNPVCSEDGVSGSVKPTEVADRSDASDACTGNPTCSETPKSAESCNSYNIAIRNIQGIDRHVANITSRTYLQTPESSHIASDPSDASETIRPKTDGQSTVTNQKEVTESQDPSLGSFGFEDPIHGMSEDGSEVVSQKDLDQESPKSFNPIMSVEEFYSSDVFTLPDHSLNQSPCYPIIDSKLDDAGFQTIYHCKLHPDLGSTFLREIENHCIKDAESHKAAILAKGESL